MDLLAYQLLATFICFLFLVFSGAVPFCFLRWRNINNKKRHDYQKKQKSFLSKHFLSFSNCFACGIFLSTCFLGLMPHVREHGIYFRKIVTEQYGYNITFTGMVDSGPILQKLLSLPETELLVIAGFLMILLVEQLVGLCHSTGNKHENKLVAASRVPLGLEFEPFLDENGKPSGSGSPPVTFTTMTTVSTDEEETSQVSIKIYDEQPAHDKHHRHHHDAADGSQEKVSLSLRSILLLFGLGVHSMFEGVALGVQDSQSTFLRLLIAIMLHECLCALAYGLTLVQQKASIRAGVVSIVVLCMTIPIGVCLGFAVPKEPTAASVGARCLLEGLAAGTFVYVACVEMLASELGHSHGNSHGGGGAGYDSQAYLGVFKALIVVVGFFVFLVFTMLG